MKETRYKARVGVFFLVLAAALLSLPSAFAAPTSVFTRYNIHVQEKASRSGDHIYNASYANYTSPGAGHLIIPAGTEITVMERKKKAFRFRVESDKRVVDFEFHEPRMKMSVDQYIGLITSPKPVSLGRFSKIDKKGISEGKAFVGMSREGVMGALGYPATHRTPSVDSPTWVYWTNRFGTVAINFDAQGIVESIKN